jgi:hypothetical protein
MGLCPFGKKKMILVVAAATTTTMMIIYDFRISYWHKDDDVLLGCDAV